MIVKICKHKSLWSVMQMHQIFFLYLYVWSTSDLLKIICCIESKETEKLDATEISIQMPELLLEKWPNFQTVTWGQCKTWVFLLNPMDGTKLKAEWNKITP